VATATITKTGPIFAPNVSQEVKSAVRQGLFDIAVEITGDVQEQLYAGHGWVTGRLRGSIGARQFSDLGYEVRSGAISGDVVPYTYWIETGQRRGSQTRFRGYHMFERTADAWDNNRTRIGHLMGRALVRAFS
jgi:hypothetical protein